MVSLPAAETGVPTERLVVSGLGVRYGDKIALSDVNMSLMGPGVTALIGPSGCGKSSFLRCLNRMNDTIVDAEIFGQITLDGQPLYGKDVDAVAVRRAVGMVFQKPNPFPKSIYENIAYGVRLHGLAKKRAQMDDIVADSLIRAGLWPEVKDRLSQPAMALSGGQQQRLCIARAIAIKPSVLLMDEPCSALDPIATEKVEALISKLAGIMPVVMVTHNLSQAHRLAKWAAYFHLGRCVEFAPAQNLFENPKNQLTRDYISGRFG